MNIVTPKIELIASTQLTNTQAGGTVIEELMNLDPSATDAENLIEYGGRGCYEQWSKPREATRKNKDYIRRTAFEMQHGSILEHASVTLRFSGVSRAWLTEMSRHRHLSWSVVSQRYVDATTFGVVIPPALLDRDFDGEFRDSWIADAENALSLYQGYVDDLTVNGDPGKREREAARGILPNCLETRGVVTGNLRAWSTILPLRAHPSADREMQGVSMLILDAIHPVAPTVTNHIRQQIEEHA